MIHVKDKLAFDFLNHLLNEAMMAHTSLRVAVLFLGRLWGRFFWLFLVNLLNLVKFAHKRRKDDCALEPRVEKQTCEEEWVVEPTDIFEYTHDCVDVTSVHIYLLVHFEHLEEVEANSWPSVWVSYQVGLTTHLIEVVWSLCNEEAEDVVVQFNVVLFVPDSGLQSIVLQQGIVDIFHVVLDRLLIVIDVKLSADHNLYHCHLSDPLFKVSIICTLRVRVLASLEDQLHSFVNRRVKVSLKCQVCGIRTVVHFDTILFNLCCILIEEILPYYTAWERYRCDLYISISGAISLVCQHCHCLLLKDQFAIVRIIICLTSIEVTQHESEGYVLLGYHFSWHEWIRLLNYRVHLDLGLIAEDEVSQWISSCWNNENHHAHWEEATAWGTELVFTLVSELNWLRIDVNAFQEFLQPFLTYHCFAEKMIYLLLS